MRRRDGGVSLPAAHTLLELAEQINSQGVGAWPWRWQFTVEERAEIRGLLEELRT